jgi:hypothetical protein
VRKQSISSLRYLFKTLENIKEESAGKKKMVAVLEINYKISKGGGKI